MSSDEDGTYDDFAEFYVSGGYGRYSQSMAERVPAILDRFDADGEKLLDLACGDGAFAVEMAKQGYQVTGVDVSDQMVSYAKETAPAELDEVEFRQGDVRELSTDEEFDVATCWFDSLNHILEYEDLKRAFENVADALRDGGLFIFDVNTLHRLANKPQVLGEDASLVERDSEEFFEAYHDMTFDFETNVLSFTITGFKKVGDRWERIDEEHAERGYRFAEIADCIDDAGFEQLARWGDVEEKTEPKHDTGRVWYVLRK